MSSDVVSLQSAITLLQCNVILREVVPCKWCEVVKCHWTNVLWSTIDLMGLKNYSFPTIYRWQWYDVAKHRQHGTSSIRCGSRTRSLNLKGRHSVFSVPADRHACLAKAESAAYTHNFADVVSCQFSCIHDGAPRPYSELCLNYPPICR